MQALPTRLGTMTPSGQLLAGGNIGSGGHGRHSNSRVQPVASVLGTQTPWQESAGGSAMDGQGAVSTHSKPRVQPDWSFFGMNSPLGQSLLGGSITAGHSGRGSQSVPETFEATELSGASAVPLLQATSARPATRHEKARSVCITDPLSLDGQGAAPRSAVKAALRCGPLFCVLARPRAFRCAACTFLL